MKDTTLPIILRGLQDKKTRGPAARVLGDMGPEARETAGELAKFLDDSDDRDRVKLAVAILRVGGPKEAAIEVLLEALKNPEQRSFALIVMGNLGPEAAELIPAVQSLTQDRRPWVRGSAHEVLRKIDPKGSIER
jgi:HEAT repeat protein